MCGQQLGSEDLSVTIILDDSMCDHGFGHLLLQAELLKQDAKTKSMLGALASNKEDGRKADSTLRSSQAVPHPSTDRALRCLTSEVKRDPVHSTRYGRRRNI